MRTRCTLCRQRFQNLKCLKNHYKKSHSKIQIIKDLVKKSVQCATPKRLLKNKKATMCQIIYLNEKVQMCSNGPILIELIFVEPPEPKKETPAPARRSRKNKHPRKLIHINLRKVPMALNEKNGEFYECHCRDDLETEPETSRIFHCNFCGFAFHNLRELTDHEILHQYYCKLCNQIFVPSKKNHTEQHRERVFVCYLCGLEFLYRDLLVGHLGYHFEQQTFEHILNLEQDYNLVPPQNSEFLSADYSTQMEKILFFLTYQDHLFNRNMEKVLCSICFQECFAFDFERHLKLFHCFR